MQPFRTPSPKNKFLAVITIVLFAAGSAWAAPKEDVAPTDAKRFAALTKVPEGHDGWIRLPLRIYIVTGVVLEQKSVKMTTWITPKQIENTVLPEINRIWKPAKIEWVLDKIVEQPAIKIPNLEEALTCIQNAKRDEHGRSDPTRVPHIHALCDKKNCHRVINNLYFFPYLGQTSQGFASLTGNWGVRWRLD